MMAYLSHHDSTRLVSRLAIIGLALLMLVLPLLGGRWLRLSVAGERAEGVILATDMLIEFMPSGQVSRTYAATYVFDAVMPDGSVIHLTLEEDISRAWHEALNPGQTVSVRYSPRRPDFAMIEGNRAKIANELMVVLGLSLAGVAALLALAPLIDLIRQDDSQAGRLARG